MANETDIFQTQQGCNEWIQEASDIPKSDEEMRRENSSTCRKAAPFVLALH